MELNLSQYKRLITFGCSFTNYKWPMWPEIIASDIPNIKLYNYGEVGAGNLQIACRISQAHKLLNFNENDLVIVMWSSYIREDRFYKGKWQSWGNVYNNHYYDDNFCKKYVDPIGFLKRDCELIHLAKIMLEGLPCKSIMLKSYPFKSSEGINSNFLSDIDTFNLLPELENNYSDMFASMPVSLCETIYPGFPNRSEEWHKVGHSYDKFNDSHPCPIISYQYLEKIGMPLSEKAKQYAITQTEHLKKFTTFDEIRKFFKENK